MAKVNVLRNNMTGGEISPRLLARQDVTKVANGCKSILNGIVVPHGGIYKRPGTKFVIDTASTERHRFIPFQYSTEQSYMLLFGENFIWFFRDGAPLTFPGKTITNVTQANPAVVTSASHGFSNGDQVRITGVGGMTSLNNRWFTVANVATNTFELSGVDSSGYDAYTSGGSAAELLKLTTTYAWEEISDIQTQQINDVMYITHPLHPPRKLSRASDTSWTLSEPVYDTGPFRTVNADEITLTPTSPSTSATAWGTYTVGTTFTLGASDDYFTSDMVGAYFRLYEAGGGTGIGGAPVGDSTQAISNGQSYSYQGNVYGVANVTGVTTWADFTRVPEHTSGIVRVSVSGSKYFDSYFLHPGYCIVQVTGYTSATSVTVQLITFQLPNSISTSGTDYWQEGAWSDYRGWPRSCTLFEQRMWFAGTVYDPTVVWGSRSGAYEDFEDGEDDDDAVTYRLSSGMADVIRWIRGRRVLTAGTSQGEFALMASSQQEALTPTNVKASLQTDLGASSVIPVAINQAVLYPQRRGEPDNDAIRLREFAYEFSQDRFNSVDLNIYAEHVLKGGIRRVAYMREPESLIWVLLADGTLACCTYEREQEVVSWHRHTIPNATVLDIGVTSGDNGEEMWLQVLRTIDGVDRSYIEYMKPRFEEGIDSKEDAWLVDCGLEYDGSATGTLSGLWHLRGETVKVLNNGTVEDVTISALGKITSLAADTTRAIVGYGYQLVIEPTELTEGAQGGTPKTRPKNIASAWLYLMSSLGGSIGTTAANQKPLLYRTNTTPMDATPPLHTGWVEVDLSADWDTEQHIRIEHDDPLPFFVQAIVAESSVTG
jgi:hypothetical protein